MVFNFPEMGYVAGRPIIYTRLKFPAWCKGLLLRPAIKSFKIKDIEITDVSSKFDLDKLALPFGEDREILDTIFKAVKRVGGWLHPAEVYEALKKLHPPDGREMVEWMFISTAEALTLRARMNEYNQQAGAYATGNATDPRFPGLEVEDVRFLSESGRTIRRRGYGIVETPRGRYNVPFPGKATGIFKDHVSWGSTSYAGAVQWTASLIKWKRFLETPIRQRVGFYMDFRGNTAPNFFAQIPSMPKPRCHLLMRFSSDRDQTITIRFRDPTNYSSVLGERKLRVRKGRAEVSTTITGYPYVPPVVSEVQPENNAQTTLDLYVVE